jgi:hypothetical protein
MPSVAKRAPAGRHISCEVSPRWGSNRIIALRFYKYVAPLGLKNSSFFILHSSLRGRSPRFARGIEAEPPAKCRRHDAGDGADSPTRAPEGREAARPNPNFEGFLLHNPHIHAADILRQICDASIADIEVA